jgi:hypothetical protein
MSVTYHTKTVGNVEVFYRESCPTHPLAPTEIDKWWPIIRSASIRVD